MCLCILSQYIIVRSSAVVAIVVGAVFFFFFVRGILFRDENSDSIQNEYNIEEIQTIAVYYTDLNFYR